MIHGMHNCNLIMHNCNLICHCNLNCARSKRCTCDVIMNGVDLIPVKFNNFNLCSG